MQLGECKSELLADDSTCDIAANNVNSGTQVSGKLSLCSIEGVRGGCQERCECKHHQMPAKLVLEL
jgi:hypothetical protein